MGNYICYYENQRQKPCPKCGSIHNGFEWEHWDYKRKRALDAYIICRDCGYRTRTHKTIDDAMVEWNG